MRGQHRKGGSRRWPAPLAGGLGVVGVLLIGVGLWSQQPSPPRADPRMASGAVGADWRTPSGGIERDLDNVEESQERAPATSQTDAAAGVRPLAAVAPSRLSIPRLGIDAPVGGLDLLGDRTLEVPDDPEYVGWYRGSAEPGSRGRSVLVGHVTWDRRPAVFFRLGELRIGDRVEVRRRDGTVAVFAVQAVDVYAKSRFPTERVYGPSSEAEIRLVTCSGRYDADAGGYAENLVAYARLVDSHRP